MLKIVVASKFVLLQTEMEREIQFNRLVMRERDGERNGERERVRERETEMERERQFNRLVMRAIHNATRPPGGICSTCFLFGPDLI